ncbi:hypothetical protein ABPG72_005864 [Tetrahymena utriculariae]
MSVYSLNSLLKYKKILLWLANVQNPDISSPLTLRQILIGSLKLYLGGFIQECDDCSLKIDNQECLQCSNSSDYQEQGKYYSCKSSCDFPFQILPQTKTCSFIPDQGLCEINLVTDRFFSDQCTCPKGQYFDQIQKKCLNCLQYCTTCENAFSCSPNSNFGYTGLKSNYLDYKYYLEICSSNGNCKMSTIVKFDNQDPNILMLKVQYLKYSDQLTSMKFSILLNYVQDEFELEIPQKLFIIPIQFYDIVLGGTLIGQRDPSIYYSRLEVYTGGFYYVNYDNQDPCFVYINRQNMSCILPKKGYALNRDGIVILTTECNLNRQSNQPLYYYNKYTMMCQNSGMILLNCKNLNAIDFACIQCIDNQMILSKSCSCPDGTYFDQPSQTCQSNFKLIYQIICILCSAVYKTCSGDQNNCLECKRQNQIPPLCNCIQSNYYIDSNLNCQQCSQQCSSCSQNQLNCLTCSLGRINPPLCYCNPALNQNSISDSISNPCLPKNCPYKCLACDLNNQCIQCRGDRIFPPYCICSQNQYDDSQTQKELCQKCDEGDYFDDFILIKAYFAQGSCPQMIPIISTLSYFSCEQMQVSQNEKGIIILQNQQPNISQITIVGWYRLIGKSNQNYLLIQSRNSVDQNVIRIVYNPVNMYIQCSILDVELSPKDISHELKAYIQDIWFFIRIGMNLQDYLIKVSQFNTFDNNNFEYFFGSTSYYPNSRSCAVSKQILAFLGLSNDSIQGPYLEISKFEMFLLPKLYLHFDFFMASSNFMYNLSDNFKMCQHFQIPDQCSKVYPYYNFKFFSGFNLNHILDFNESKGGFIQECDDCSLKIDNQECLQCANSSDYQEQGKYYSCKSSCDFPFQILSQTKTCSFIPDQGLCEINTGTDRFFSDQCTCPKGQYFDKIQKKCLNCLQYCTTCENAYSCGTTDNINYKDEFELEIPQTLFIIPPQFYDIVLGGNFFSYYDPIIFYSRLEVYTGGFYYVNYDNQDHCFVYINRQNMSCILPKQGYALNRDGVVILTTECNQNIQPNQPFYYYNKYTMMCQNSGIILPNCRNLNIIDFTYIQCIESQMILSKKCSCPDGTYFDQSSQACQSNFKLIYKLCSAACKTCSIDQNNCLECKGQNKIPPLCNCIQTSYYIDSNINCQQCSQQCNSCIQNQSDCLTCSQGRINPPLCYCNPTLYLNDQSDPITAPCQRKSCPNKCLVCDNNNQCVLCRGDRVLPPYCICTQDYYDDPLIEQELCQKCEEGFYFDDTQQQLFLSSSALGNPLLDIMKQQNINIINVQTEQTEKDDSSRNLSSSTIRFSYDDQELKESNNPFHIKIILRALKIAFNFYEQFIKVKNPLGGEIYINCLFVLQSAQHMRNQTGQLKQELVAGIIHEIFQALVFSQLLYQYYVNSTPDQYGINQQGKPVLAFPEVLSFTQQHFDCSEITQVYLENSGDITWSGINNALLKDSGWYDVNMNFHDRLFWGKGKWCDFYFRTCLSEPRPNEFCVHLTNNTRIQVIIMKDMIINALKYLIMSVIYTCLQMKLLDLEEKINSDIENSSPYQLDSQQAQCYPQKCIQSGDKMTIEFTIGSKIDRAQKVACEQDGQILTRFCMNQIYICANGYSGEDCSIDNQNKVDELKTLDSFCDQYDDNNDCLNCKEGYELIGGSCSCPPIIPILKTLTYFSSEQMQFSQYEKGISILQDQKANIFSITTTGWYRLKGKSNQNDLLIQSRNTPSDNIIRIVYNPVKIQIQCSIFNIDLSPYNIANQLKVFLQDKWFFIRIGINLQDQISSKSYIYYSIIFQQNSFITQTLIQTSQFITFDNQNFEYFFGSTSYYPYSRSCAASKQVLAFLGVANDSSQGPFLEVSQFEMFMLPKLFLHLNFFMASSNFLYNQSDNFKSCMQFSYFKPYAIKYPFYKFQPNSALFYSYILDFQELQVLIIEFDILVSKNDQNQFETVLQIYSFYYNAYYEIQIDQYSNMYEYFFDDELTNQCDDCSLKISDQDCLYCAKTSDYLEEAQSGSCKTSCSNPFQNMIDANTKTCSFTPNQGMCDNGQFTGRDRFFTNNCTCPKGQYFDIQKNKCLNCLQYCNTCKNENSCDPNDIQSYNDNPRLVFGLQSPLYSNSYPLCGYLNSNEIELEIPQQPFITPFQYEIIFGSIEVFGDSHIQYTALQIYTGGFYYVNYDNQDTCLVYINRQNMKCIYPKQGYTLNNEGVIIASNDCNIDIKQNQPLYFYNNYTMICQNSGIILSNCRNINIIDKKCTQCIESQMILSKNCQCPDGMFFDQLSQSCRRCSPLCKICSVFNYNCLECKDSNQIPPQCDCTQQNYYIQGFNREIQYIIDSSIYIHTKKQEKSEQIIKNAIKALHEIWDSISDEIVSNTIDQINVNLREVSANNGEIFIEF